MEKIAAYQQKIQEIEAKILKGEEEKQKEKSEGLQLFVKYKGLEELSRFFLILLLPEIRPCISIQFQYVPDHKNL